MDEKEIKAKGKKLGSVGGLSFYHVPDPNSIGSKAVRAAQNYMGNRKGVTTGRNNPRGARGAR